MFLICGNCGAYHKITWISRELKFQYHCGTTRYLIDQKAGAYEYAPRKVILINPPEPALN
jgi:hypothetical protein